MKNIFIKLTLSIFFIIILGNIVSCIPLPAAKPKEEAPTTTILLRVLTPTPPSQPSSTPTETPLAVPTEEVTPEATRNPTLAPPDKIATPYKTLEINQLIGVALNKSNDELIVVTKDGIDLYNLINLNIEKSFNTSRTKTDLTYNGTTENYSFNQSSNKEWLVLGQWAHYLSASGTSQRGQMTAIQIGTGLIKILGQDLNTSIMIAPFINVRYSPDNQLIAGEMDAQNSGVQIWNLKNQLLYTLNVFKSLKSLDFSSNSNQLAICAINGNLEIHEISTGKLLGVLGKATQDTSKGSCGLNFSHNGSLLAYYGDDQLINLWDTHTSNIVRHLPGQNSALDQIIFSPDDQNIATLGSDGRVRVWNINGHQEIFLWDNQDEVIKSIQYSPDGRFLLGIDAQENILIWNPLKKSYSGKIKGKDLIFSADNQFMVTSTADGKIMFWKMSVID